MPRTKQLPPKTGIGWAGVGVRILSALVVGCVLLASCGSDPSGSEASDSDRVSLSYAESPINDLLGIDIALRAGDLVELERSAERSVVECMKAVGFEYVAVDFASQFEPEAGAEDPESREYAELNGYGISIRPVIDLPKTEAFVDPNDELRSQLPEAELEAYSLALYGPTGPDGEPLAPEDRSGCVADAYDTVYAARAEFGAVEEFFGEFGAELAELEQRFRSDPRFIELEAEWSTCMAEQGFTVVVREEIFVQLNLRMSEVAPLLVGGEEPPPEVEQMMDDVRDWERHVALADWDCTQDVQDQMQTLRYGYEALFLDEQQGRIDSGS